MEEYMVFNMQDTGKKSNKSQLIHYLLFFFTLACVQGEKGDSGEPGERGEKGEMGLSGPSVCHLIKPLCSQCRT